MFDTSFKNSFIRTFVPLVVGFVVTLAAKNGFEIDDATAASFLTMLISGGYYGVVRIIEEKYPAWGRLLGVTGKPSYQDDESVTIVHAHDHDGCVDCVEGDPFH